MYETIDYEEAYWKLDAMMRRRREVDLLNEGKAIGINEGKAIGINEGKAIGFNEGQESAIRSLFQSGMKPEEISSRLNIPLDHVCNLFNESYDWMQRTVSRMKQEESDEKTGRTP